MCVRACARVELTKNDMNTYKYAPLWKLDAVNSYGFVGYLKSKNDGSFLGLIAGDAANSVYPLTMGRNTKTFALGSILLNSVDTWNGTPDASAFDRVFFGEPITGFMWTNTAVGFQTTSSSHLLGQAEAPFYWLGQGPIAMTWTIDPSTVPWNFTMPALPAGQMVTQITTTDPSLAVQTSSASWRIYSDRSWTLDASETVGATTHYGFCGFLRAKVGGHFLGLIRDDKLQTKYPIRQLVTRDGNAPIATTPTVADWDEIILPAGCYISGIRVCQEGVGFHVYGTAAGSNYTSVGSPVVFVCLPDWEFTQRPFDLTLDTQQASVVLTGLIISMPIGGIAVPASVPMSCSIADVRSIGTGSRVALADEGSNATATSTSSSSAVVALVVGSVVLVLVGLVGLALWKSYRRKQKENGQEQRLGENVTVVQSKDEAA